MTDWEGMSPNEIMAAGVLWAINSFVLWPLGLALGVKLPSDNPWDDIHFMELKNPETITEGRVDLSQELGGCHPRDRFIKYAEARIAEMPTEMEQEMARKKMRILFAGFGISPIRKNDQSDPAGVP